MTCAGASVAGVLGRSPAHCWLLVSEPAALPGHNCAPHLCSPGGKLTHLSSSHHESRCHRDLQLLLRDACPQDAHGSTPGLSGLPCVQAVALRETQLQTLVDDLDGFVHSSALASAAWLAQIDGLIFPHRSVHGPCFLAAKPANIAWLLQDSTIAGSMHQYHEHLWYTPCCRVVLIWPGFLHAPGW